MCVLGVFGLSACDDIDDFTTSPNNMLTFSTDTVRIDTVFSTVPSSTRDFWVSNRSGKGLRCTSVRLEGGNQNGFRVNVDGVYLSPEQGYKANYIEVRNKDSIRVFVEVTTAVNHGDAPKELNDRLVFALESGVEQKVVLNAWSWDADFARNKTITTDYTITAGKPLVVYGPLTVEEGATLTIAPGATLFFHDGAGIDVKGRLVCKGTAEQPVTLRGDRLDYMFDYLPYDRMSGLWNGVHFMEKSYDNRMEFTDLHSAFNGVRVDSSDVARQTLTIANSTIHNCQGHALYVENSKVTVENSQLTNALNNCLGVEGGDVLVNNCTLAQFYPFDSNRASALSFSALKHPLQQFVCRNTLITGYSADEMMGGKLSCIIDARMVPVLPGAEKAADDFLYTAAGQRNRNHTGPYVTFENVPFAMEEVLFDPQTSGGLLLAVLPEEANALEAELQAAGLPAKIVGEIIPKTEQEITVKY